MLSVYYEEYHYYHVIISIKYNSLSSSFLASWAQPDYILLLYTISWIYMYVHVRTSPCTVLCTLLCGMIRCLAIQTNNKFGSIVWSYEFYFMYVHGTRVILWGHNNIMGIHFCIYMMNSSICLVLLKCLLVCVYFIFQ